MQKPRGEDLARVGEAAADQELHREERSDFHDLLLVCAIPERGRETLPSQLMRHSRATTHMVTFFVRLVRDDHSSSGKIEKDRALKNVCALSKSY